MQIDIEDIAVKFPFEPYPVQVDYMREIIQCLNKKSHALLESPTGTGKTLCLLSASLAWRKHRAFHAGVNPISSKADRANGAPDIPYKIYYTSRTHSQLNQVINELKNLEYAPKVTILGSRDQLCIHPKNKTLPSSYAKLQGCKALRRDKACVYHNKLEASKPDATGDSSNQTADTYGGILDIEDLLSISNLHQHCPYFLTRSLQESAELIFAPYNYIFDASIRESEKLSLENSIVIFDEGHNIPSFCESAASIEFEPDLLIGCAADLQTCANGLLNVNSSLKDKQKPVPSSLTPEFCFSMMKGLSNLEILVQKYPLDENHVYVPKGPSAEKEIFTLFLQAMKIDHQNAQDTLANLRSAVDFIGSLKEDELLNESSAFEGSGKGEYLYAFEKNLKTLFTLAPSQLHNFIMHVQCKEEARGARTLGFWCMTSSPVTTELLRLGVRNIIVTSGTLSPLSSFAHEAGLHFQHTIENTHVIRNNQAFVQILKRGPNNLTLNSSFKNRNSDSLLMELGELVIHVSAVSPNGMLVFFPSYGAMDRTLAFWRKGQPLSSGSLLSAEEKKKTIYDLIAARKKIIIEPKNKHELSKAMKQYYKHALKNHASTLTISNTSPNLGGAIFFAVCRGKVSEGIDFSDIFGRTVIVTGIPYPSLFEQRVIQKRGFLDRAKTSNTLARGSEPIDRASFAGLTGGEWYKLEATRAVNQAIGRIIRHKNDFGSIIFADERFAAPDVRPLLSKWVQTQLTIQPEFSKLYSGLSEFFASATTQYPVSERQRQKLHKLVSSSHLDEDMFGSTTDYRSAQGPSSVFKSVNCNLQIEHKRGHATSFAASKIPLVTNPYKDLSLFPTLKHQSTPSQDLLTKARFNAPNYSLSTQSLMQRRKKTRIQNSLFDNDISSADIMPTPFYEETAESKPSTSCPKNPIVRLMPSLADTELIAVSKTLVAAIGIEKYKKMHALVKSYKQDRQEPVFFESIYQLFLELDGFASLIENFSYFLKPPDRKSFVAFINSKM